MTIRWKKLAPIVAVAILIGILPYIYQSVAPERFSGIACVRPYPDGRVEKGKGESCYGPNLPEALVLKSR